MQFESRSPATLLTSGSRCSRVDEMLAGHVCDLGFASRPKAIEIDTTEKSIVSIQHVTCTSATPFHANQFVLRHNKF